MGEKSEQKASTLGAPPDDEQLTGMLLARWSIDTALGTVSMTPLDSDVTYAERGGQGSRPIDQKHTPMAQFEEEEEEEALPIRSRDEV